jgi:hypothetical protein
VNLECLDGELGCDGAKKAKVKITIDKQVLNVEFPAPVCVEKTSSKEVGSTELKCWRFWAEADGEITFQHYACGKEAYYQPIPNGFKNSAYLIVDGIQQNGDYAYWKGVFDGVSNDRFLEVATEVKVGPAITGNCDLCNGLIDKCQIIVTNNDGSQYKSPKGDNCSFKIACDAACPPGDVRCEHPAYPGYCCIPCQGTAQKINNLANNIN